MATVPTSSQPLRSDEGGSGFPRLLKTWRARRRLSQLELALAAGVSQRHVSFLEGGRASPSRSMIGQLGDALDVPLRERNEWLRAAGFAPVYDSRSLDDPQMSRVMAAIRAMLTNHEPFPAVLVDRAWNIRLANRPFAMMEAALGPDLWTRVGGATRNLMRLCFHPNGIRPFVLNWNDVAPLLWCRAQREADALAGQDMTLVLDDLRRFQEPELLKRADDASLVPVLPITIAIGEVRLSLFTVISTFGTAQDITADELRIEHFFPADDATERLFRQGAGSEGIAGPAPGA
jgi:transcriptional regulator with XRE-family HTH domain